MNAPRIVSRPRVLALALVLPVMLIGYSVGVAAADPSRTGAVHVVDETTLAEGRLESQDMRIVARTHSSGAREVCATAGGTTACTDADAARPMIVTGQDGDGPITVLAVDPRGGLARLDVTLPTGSVSHRSHDGLWAGAGELREMPLAVRAIDRSGRVVGELTRSTYDAVHRAADANKDREPHH